MNLNNFRKIFEKLPRIQKQAIIASTDTILLLIALWGAFSLRLGEFYLPDSRVLAALFLPIPFLAIPIFIQFGLYRAIIRYIGLKALWAVVQAATLYAIVWGLLIVFTRIEGVPRSVVLINWLVALLFIGGTRMVARWWLSGVITERKANGPSRTKVVIYGAGSAGVQLATALSYSSEYKPVAFIDDKSEMHNTHVNSLRVYPFNALGILIKKMKVQEVLLAIPTASRSERRHVIQLLEEYPVHVRILPGMADIAGGQVKIEDIKDVDIEDLLGRDPVEPYIDLLDSNIHNKVVMVTGAGGSIGSELCKQITKQQPRRLVIFEQNEFALYSVELELMQICKSNHNDIICEIIPILGTVLDRQRMEQVCQAFSVNTIYHAAAYKHVPLVEKNPIEAIRNNVFGTLATAQAAINSKVETFVLISTDKAVRPTNIMGASKRFAELILQALAENSVSICFSMVRFGNVLGSSGSVVPVFRKQIEQGGPVTVTHPDIIRYFMTIPEAAQLVIQAGAMGVGGDVFVLDMGEPVKIDDLARKMISLSGFDVKEAGNINGDIAIEYVGLRPGEKLYEELLIGNNPVGTKHPRIFRATEEHIHWDKLKMHINDLDVELKAANCEYALKVMLNVISDYNPQGTIEDFVWKETQIKNDKNRVILLKDFRDKTKVDNAG